MADKKEKPLTRGDLERKIEEHGGKAKGLDLSGKVFEEEIDLRGLNNNHLQGIILDNARFPLNLRRDARDAPLRGANLKGVHLEEAHLRNTHLEEADLSDTYLESANLGGTYLEGANLSGAHLGSAYLGGAHLQGAFLLSTEFSTDTGLEDVDWGNYKLMDENMGYDNGVYTYRRLKQWYTEHGMYDVAGEFFYREMEVKRKAQSWKKKPHLKLWGWVMRLLCGYGERLKRMLIWISAIVFGLAGAYYLWGSFSSSSFWDTLYYSAASFTALGYGQWAPQPTGWAKGMGAAEAVIGVFMMALFLITFVRKMTR